MRGFIQVVQLDDKPKDLKSYLCVWQAVITFAPTLSEAIWNAARKVKQVSTSTTVCNSAALNQLRTHKLDLKI